MTRLMLRTAWDILRGVIFALLLYYAVQRLIFADVGGTLFRYAGY